MSTLQVMCYWLQVTSATLQREENHKKKTPITKKTPCWVATNLNQVLIEHFVSLSSTHEGTRANTNVCSFIRPACLRVFACPHAHFIMNNKQKRDIISQVVRPAYPGSVILLTVIVCDRFNSSPARISFVFPALWAKAFGGAETA